MSNNCNNGEIVWYAVRGAWAETKTGAMSTRPGTNGSMGYMPRRVAQTMQAVRERISQTIYSYYTPIALCVDGIWVIPDATYSATTSSKHQSQLWTLGEFVYVPDDCSVEELERVLKGYMRYLRWEKKWVPGPNWVPGC